MSALRLAALALMLLWPALGAAQQPQALPTPRQIELAQEAGEASERGDYEGAARLLEEALKEGRLNVLLLNLGRSRYRLSQCEAAKAAFDQVAEAPQVADPPPEVVAEMLARFQRELGACTGDLIVRCFDARLTLLIDGERVGTCDVRMALRPGAHRLDVALGERETSIRFAIRPSKTLELTVGADALPTPLDGEAVELPTPLDGETVELPTPLDGEAVEGAAVGDPLNALPTLDAEGDLGPIAVEIEPVPPKLPIKGVSEPFHAGGWGTVGAGAGVLGVGVLIDVLALGPKLDEYEAALRDQDAAEREIRGQLDALRPALLATYAVGAALVGVGALMVLTDTGVEEPSTPPAGLLPWVGPASAGVRWGQAW